MILATVFGSSPLARGLPGGVSGCVRPRGIIPARAGFTRRRGRRRRRGPDHPRSRGVYHVEQESDKAAVGSSPLARGLHLQPAQLRGRARIIPARAGFTGVGGEFGPHGGDHPRSRGVYSHTLEMRVQRVGSSPLARGLRRGLARKYCVARIIPARAGFTPGSLRGRAPVPDHPRSRGVYLSSAPSSCGSEGSSPLARGLRQNTADRLGGVRIIPARAGFTRPRPWRAPGGTDHPRSRGVYRLELGERGEITGSSPLARGLPA